MASLSSFVTIIGLVLAAVFAISEAQSGTFSPFQNVHFLSSNGESEGGPTSSEVVVNFAANAVLPSVFSSSSTSFLCGDFLSAKVVSTGTELIGAALCRYCPVPGQVNVASLVLPPILTEITSNSVTLTLKSNANQKDIAIKKFSPPNLVSAEFITVQQVVFFFDVPVSIIRGSRTIKPGKVSNVLCSDLATFNFLGGRVIIGGRREIAPRCDATLNATNNAVIIDFLSATDYIFGAERPTGFSLTPSTFFSEAELFGISGTEDEGSLIEPPRLISATLNSNVTMTLEFDSPTNQVNIDSINCGSIFQLIVLDFGSDTFIDLFALTTKSYTCAISFVSSTQAILGFPTGVPFFNSDSSARLSFNGAATIPFKKANGLGSAFAFPDITISGDFDALLPQFEVFGPSELTECDTFFEVQAVQTGGAPTDVTTVFSVAINGTFASAAQLALFCPVITAQTLKCNALVLATAVLGLNLGTFTRVFEVSVAISDAATGTDVLQEGALTLSFDQVFGTKKIPATISGVANGSVVSLQRGNSRSFQAVIGNFAACLSGAALTNSLQFSWQINSTVVSTKKILSIGDSQLEVADHAISFSVSAPGVLGVVANTLGFTLRITPAPVVIVSTAGELVTIGSDATSFTLDASRSCNPNVVGSNCQTGLGFINQPALQNLNDTALRAITGLPSPQFAVQWSCVSCNSTENASLILTGINFNQMRVVVPTNTPAFNLSVKDYEWSFFVTDVNNAATFPAIKFVVSVALVEAACPLFSVAIAPVDPKVNVDKDVILTGIAEGFAQKRVKVAWNQISTAAKNIFDVASPLLARPSLFIPAGTLVEGLNYQFRLTSIPLGCPTGIVIPTSVAQVSFLANRSPVNGKLGLSQTVGKAGITQFTLTAQNWVDIDQDLPLTYSFEVAFNSQNISELTASNPNFVFDARKVQQLTSGFQSSNSFTTVLQFAPNPTDFIYIISRARDALGATSQRTLSAAAVVTLENPFAANDNSNVPDINLINVSDIISLIDDLINNGDQSSVPQLCSAITSALNSFTEIPPEFDDLFFQVRDLCFLEVTRSLDNTADLDIDLITSIASSYSSITQNSNQITPELAGDITNATQSLIDQARELALATIRGFQDPKAATIIPDALRQGILDAISNLLAASQILNSDLGEFNDTSSTGSRLLSASYELEERRARIAGYRRQTLNSSDESDFCRLLDDARSSVEGVANLQNQFVVQGAPAISAESTNVQFSAAREAFNLIGDTTTDLNIADSTGNQIRLPPGFFDDISLDNNISGDSDINIFVAQWLTTIDCDVDKRIIEDVDDLSCDSNFLATTPQKNKQGNIISVDFFPFTDLNGRLTVDSLSNGLEILFDKPTDTYSSSVAEQCNNTLEAPEFFEYTQDFVDSFTCGFIDPDTGDFLTTGCEVVFSDELPDDKLLCRCFHATDFAAWTAFKYDVKETFLGQIILSPLSEKILISFVGVLTFLMVVMFYWAYYKDNQDSEKLIQGSLARIKINRIINRKSKRQFFDSYQQARLEESASDIPIEAVAVVEDKDMKVETKPHRTIWWKQFWLACKYEHSLFGIVRYDPNFTRWQRVAVFFGVLIANFGAAALCFELNNNAYQITILFTLGVSFAAAFLVSIPIKLLVRLLFKVTEKRVGSKEDMVGNMYKIVARVEYADGIESEHDVELVTAIHELYVAQKNISKSYPKKGKGNAINDKTLHPDEKKVHRVDEEAVEVAEAVMVVETNEEDNDLLDAMAAFNQARQKLTQVTLSARNSWREAESKREMSAKFYTSFDKIKNVRKQKSGFMKVVASVADEPSLAAKPRKARLSWYFLYINYVVLFLILGFYVFYIIKFIGTRQEASQRPPNLNQGANGQTLTERNIFQQWVIGGTGGVLISYLVAEPLVALIRYVITPQILHWFGRKPEDIDELTAELKAVDEEKKENNIRESKLHYGFDVFADLVENFF